MKALVVEDDAKVARLLARALSEEGYTVDTCASGLEAIRQATAVAYDSIVLDWMLREGDGLDVCRTLRQAGSTVPILMLTARGEVSERVLGLDAGADDYLVKPFHIEEFLARVRSLQRRAGGGYASMRVGPIELQRIERRALLSGQILDLTVREYALLLHLAYRVDRIVTRTDLLTQVWESRIDPGSNVVDVHVSHLRDKLGDEAWMIETVRGQGYRLRSRREP
ncbi:MAG: response regulator transcription factor [Deltaproteobacteria bacterium]|nr:response regulator transcription factor [Deltaproteobacteria bacterium]